MYGRLPQSASKRRLVREGSEPEESVADWQNGRPKKKHTAIMGLNRRHLSERVSTSKKKPHLEREKGQLANRSPVKTAKVRIRKRPSTFLSEHQPFLFVVSKPRLPTWGVVFHLNGKKAGSRKGQGIFHQLDSTVPAPVSSRPLKNYCRKDYQAYKLPSKELPEE
jgi:hypothetical protein